MRLSAYRTRIPSIYAAELHSRYTRGENHAEKASMRRETGMYAPLQPPKQLHQQDG